SDILNIIFQGIPYDLLEEKEIAFKCNCSRERVEAALISLGMEELERLVVEEGGAQVKCEFCKALYEFDEKDLKALQDEVIRKVH
ncbi:MAG TPA: Hsp33 family molecular chaperone HslO, partial [Desulfobacterales bacterium]|nr:Hsp33 family molecular chaperone HslO [Desulfobacterales bacterium]